MPFLVKIVSLGNSRIERICGCSAILTVTVVILKYSQLHKRLITQQFGGFGRKCIA